MHSLFLKIHFSVQQSVDFCKVTQVYFVKLLTYFDKRTIDFLQHFMQFHRHYVHFPKPGMNIKCIFIKEIDKVVLMPHVKRLWRKLLTVRNTFDKFYLLLALGVCPFSDRALSLK